jgi:SMC interacting uncharacterized protein involved in chromosome segregation
MEKRKAKTDTGLSQKLTDPRPLKEKDFQMKTLRSLIKYLVINSYPFPVSLNVCLSGDMQVFKEISEFLLRKIDPMLGYSTEKELLDILKAINYPYPLHSHYFSGASNYYPYLLGVLEWLFKTVSNLEQPSEINIHLQYFVEGYQLFMEDKPLNSFRLKFQEKMEKYCESVEAKLEENWENVKNLRKTKKILKFDHVPIVMEELELKRTDVENELQVNIQLNDELKLFEAYYEDFLKEIRNFFPEGIPSVEDVRNLAKDDEKFNLKIHEIQLEIEEIKASLQSYAQDENIKEEGDDEKFHEFEIIQEEIDCFRRGNSDLMEEIENFDDIIGKIKNELDDLHLVNLEKMAVAEKNLRNDLNAVFLHTQKMKELLNNE